MKQLVKFAALLLLAGTFAASCSKDNDTVTKDDAEVVNPAGETVSIKVSLPESLTKVSMTPDGDDAGIKLAWESGDQIRVISGSNSQAFTIEAGFTEHAGTFTGTAVTGTSFDILYPGTLASIDEAEAISCGDQTQSGNNSAAHLQYLTVLEGVDTYENVAFTSEWATAHGGTLKRSGVLRVRVQLPSDVASISSLTISADADVFATDVENNAAGYASEITVDLGTADISSDHVLSVYLLRPWTDESIPAGTTLTFKMVTADKDVYVRALTTADVTTLKAGYVNALKFNCNTVGTNVELLPFAGGSGTSTDPWLIANKRQMMNMASNMVAGETKYFKLLNDVDITGETWVPLNYASPFTNGLYFDGNGKTITGLTAGSSTGYPSFAGVLYGTVKDVTFDKATINSGNNTTGVVAGYIGTGSLSGTCSGVNVTNSTVTGGTKNRIGGLAGYACILSDAITDCTVSNTTVTGSAQRVGGLIGQSDGDVINCTASNVTVSGTTNIGGLIGVAYKAVTNCTSSGAASSSNTTSNLDIGVGGLVGYFEKGTMTGCSSSVVINQTTNGRDIGGLVGKMLAGTIDKCYATGAVKGMQRNVGGLVGLVTLTSGTAAISNSYCTGDVTANAYCGGFIGLYEKGTLTITNCYSSSNISATGGFAAGGLVGFAQAASISMSKSAAWNSTVTPKSYGSGDWSSGAVVGVTFPTCTMTDNYRNPAMALTAYWVPDSDYDHPNVSSSNPLVQRSGSEGSYTYAETTATSTASGQEGYPQFPYHGKVESGKTLSQLASTTLSWDSTVWDFSADLPTLK